MDINPYLQHAVDDFKKRSADDNLKSIAVPEWGDPETGEPLTIYCRPITVGERKKLERVYNQSQLGWDVTVEMIIMKALAKQDDGTFKPMFSKKDKLLFDSHLDSAVVNRVAREIKVATGSDDLAGE